VQGLSATPGNMNVTVSWTPLTNDQLGGGTFTRYRVSYREAGVTPTPNWTLATDALTTQSDASHVVSGLDNGTSYDFQVVAITSANDQEIPGNTAEVVQYPSDEPSAPLSPVVLAATATDVQFSWSAPLSDGGSALTNPNYTVTVTGPSVASNACDPGATGTVCTVGGLVNGASYVFSVVAENRMGTSPAATVTYNVPSADATLADLLVTGLGGSVAMSPTFDPQITSYSASAANGVSAVTITPTTSAAGATVTVDGAMVISGEASSAISLNVGVNEIDVVVTASDPRFTQTYTFLITRAAAVIPPTPAGGGGGMSPGVPVTPPAQVMDGDELGAVTLDGVVESDVVLVRAPSDSGWEALGSDFQMMVVTEKSSGAPEPLAPSGVMQVPQGGRIVVSGDGYMASSSVSVFAIPRMTSRSAGIRTSRNATGAMYIGSTSVSEAGTISVTFVVSTDMDLGDYVLQINGETAAAQMRSVNLMMNVIAAPPAMRAGMVQRAGFYQGFSDDFSNIGERKLRQLVRSVPKDAQAVQVLVTGVSVGMDSLRANAILAADRAATLAEELQDRGIDGEYIVTVTTSFTVDGAERSLAGKADVLTTQTGKPLSTVTVLFQEPV
jgi:hypothetical protein